MHQNASVCQLHRVGGDGAVCWFMGGLAGAHVKTRTVEGAFDFFAFEASAIKRKVLMGTAVVYSEDVSIDISKQHRCGAEHNAQCFAGGNVLNLGGFDDDGHRTASLFLAFSMQKWARINGHQHSKSELILSNRSIPEPCFSDLPGAYERQLKRAWNNPLFEGLVVDVSPSVLEDAKLRDTLDARRFMEGFQDLVERVVSLDAHVESDVILELKQSLDKSYETCCGLAGDMSEIKEAIKQLLASMMGAIHKGAGDDEKALRNLAEEEVARRLHFELLDYPLVADLLRPDELVASEALVPTLLSEALDAMPAVMSLFTPEQAEEITHSARALLGRLEGAGHDLPEARNNLNIMERAAAAHQ